MVHLVGPGEGARISALGSTYTTKTDGEVTGGAYSLVEEELWSDPMPLPQSCAGDGRGAPYFPPHPWSVPHAARRFDDEPARILTMISPSGMQRFCVAWSRGVW
jgi:hypothetical protein